MTKSSMSDQAAVPNYNHSVSFDHPFEEVDYTDFKDRYRILIKINVVITLLLIVSLGLGLWLNSTIERTDVKGIDRMGRVYDLIMHEKDS